MISAGFFTHYEMYHSTIQRVFGVAQLLQSDWDGASNQVPQKPEPFTATPPHEVNMGEPARKHSVLSPHDFIDQEDEEGDLAQGMEQQTELARERGGVDHGVSESKEPAEGDVELIGFSNNLLEEARAKAEQNKIGFDRLCEVPTLYTHTYTPMSNRTRLL